MFRQEALNHKKNPQTGCLLINTPMPYRIITPMIVLLASGFIALLAFGEYSEKFIVMGFVNASKGMIRVYPAQDGTIIKTVVRLNQTVKAGQALFVIRTAHADSKQILNNLQQRQQTLMQTIKRKTQQLNALKPLLAKKYISADAFHARQDDIAVLKQQHRLITLGILKYRQDAGAIIRAPIAGIVSNMNYHAGQYAIASKPLASILPKNTRFVAELFVPVQNAGFLHQAHHVNIRYDAYPYEHFGSYGAVITKISQSVLTDEEDSDKPFRIGQPYYTVLARLNNQSVILDGHQKKLRQGMTLSAVIAGPKKKLWRMLWAPASA